MHKALDEYGDANNELSCGRTRMVLAECMPDMVAILQATPAVTPAIDLRGRDWGNSGRLGDITFCANSNHSLGQQLCLLGRENMPVLRNDFGQKPADKTDLWR